MILSADSIPAQAALLHAQFPHRLLAEHRSRLERETRKGRDWSWSFGIPAGTDRLLASLRVLPERPGHAYLCTPLLSPELDAEARQATLTRLMEEIDQELRARDRPGLMSYQALVPETEDHGPAFEGIGMRVRARRIEFEAPLDQLPSEQDNPLLWEAMDEGSRELAIGMLAEIGKDDIDASWAPPAEEAFEEMLAGEGYAEDPEDVRIGRIDGEPAALAIAQTERSSGMGRVAYMGLMPAFRGRGLGRQVQAHGWDRLRAQEARTWRGGCYVGNRPMEALFRSLGLEEVEGQKVWLRLPDEVPSP